MPSPSVARGMDCTECGMYCEPAGVFHPWMSEPNQAALLADLLAQLTLDSVRRLEQHTDIGPGGATRLLIEAGEPRD